MDSQRICHRRGYNIPRSRRGLSGNVEGILQAYGNRKQKKPKTKEKPYANEVLEASGGDINRSILKMTTQSKVKQFDLYYDIIFVLTYEVARKSAVYRLGGNHLKEDKGSIIFRIIAYLCGMVLCLLIFERVNIGAAIAFFFVYVLIVTLRFYYFKRNK